jgi:hypothetical protein
MKSTRAAGDALHAKPGVFIDQNRHRKFRNQESRKAGRRMNLETTKPERRLLGTFSGFLAFKFFPAFLLS